MRFLVMPACVQREASFARFATQPRFRWNDIGPVTCALIREASDTYSLVGATVLRHGLYVFLLNWANFQRSVAAAPVPSTYNWFWGVQSVLTASALCCLSCADLQEAGEGQLTRAAGARWPVTPTTQILQNRTRYVKLTSHDGDQ